MPAKKRKKKKMHIEIFVDDFVEPNLNPGHWKKNPRSYKETKPFRPVLYGSKHYESTRAFNLTFEKICF